MSTMKKDEKQQQPEEVPEESPIKKARIEECRENDKPNEANLLVTGNEAMESSLDSAKGRRCPLPLELNCEIFKCLKVPIQTKFIWAMGRGIYGAFRHKLLVKIYMNNRYNPISSYKISFDQKTSKPKGKWLDPIGKDGKYLSGQIDNQRSMEIFFRRAGIQHYWRLSKKDDYPGTIMYYFEVTRMSTSSKWVFYIGLTNEENDIYPNSYAFSIAFDYCLIAGKKHAFEWPNGAIKPKANGKDDVAGCGLLLSPENELSIFFTANGILMGKQIQTNLLGDCVYPIVSMGKHADMSLETNFGDDPANKPFKYDIEKCPGLGLD